MRLGRKDQRFFFIDFETTGIDMDTLYPIEVGIIVTDENFNLIESYESLIIPGLDFIDDNYEEEALPAFKVHGILPNELKENGRLEIRVVGEIINLAAKHTINGTKPVLISDNIQFEWGCLSKLLDVTKYFHYCGWDTSLLLEVTGVGDPKPAHRALKDAGLLHAAVIKAVQIARVV